ncbi:MAG TPA: tetratricopeptide repeat protein [Bacteroidales bacterium]|nr:tetratricopeptide repeat protein [Bacteroidales bacterium]
MKYLIIIAITFLITISHPAARAGRHVDSLKYLLNKTFDKEQRIDILLDISTKYYFINIDSLLLFANQAYNEAIAAGYTQGEIRALHRKSQYYLKAGDYNMAVDLVKQARILSEKSGKKELLASTMMINGDILMSISILDQAFEYYTNALDILNVIAPLSKDKYNCLSKIATLQANMGNLDDAQKTLEDALSGAKTINDKPLILNNLNNLAGVYNLKGDHQKALGLFREALRMNRADRNNYFVAINLSNIAAVLQDLGDSTLAQNCYDSSMFYVNLTGNLHLRCNILLWRGKFFCNRNMYQKALKDLHIVFQISEESGWHNFASESAELLSRIYRESENYSEAYLYLSKHLKYLKILESEGNTKKMSELQIKYNFEKEAIRIEALNRRKTILLISALIVTVLAAIIILVLLIHLRTRSAKFKLQHKNEMLEQERVKQNLENQLEMRNKEITSNIILLQKKNEILTAVADKLIAEKERFSEDNRRFIERRITELRDNIDDTDWKNFEIQFNQVYESFYKKLDEINPDLTIYDRRLCAYLRLKMTTKEIAALTNLTTHSVEVARYRLRKKLKINNSSFSLGVFLERL